MAFHNAPRIGLLRAARLKAEAPADYLTAVDAGRWAVAAHHMLRLRQLDEIIAGRRAATK